LMVTKERVLPLLVRAVPVIVVLFLVKFITVSSQRSGLYLAHRTSPRPQPSRFLVPIPSLRQLSLRESRPAAQFTDRQQPAFTELLPSSSRLHLSLADG
jgi:hypothetical protein